MKIQEPSKISVLIVSLLLACQATATEPRAPARLDAVLNEHVEMGSHPFLYVRVEDDQGRLIYEHGAVNGELAPEQEAAGHTWMRIWSMTKLVTTVLVLDLVEDGVLSLDDPVGRFIPEFGQLRVAVAPDGRSLATIAAGGEGLDDACPFVAVELAGVMTVEDLLNHKAGFYYAKTGIDCLDEPLAKQALTSSGSTDGFIAKLARLPLIEQPGTRYHYGLNTTVLGFVAERATGSGLKTLVEKRITRPFGIRGLRYDLPDGVALPGRFSGTDGSLRPAAVSDLDLMGPGVPSYELQGKLHLGGEGMIATAEGFADFLQILLGGGQWQGKRLLEAETVVDMTSPKTQLDNPFGYSGYTLWINNGRRPDGSTGPGGLWMGGGYEGTHYWIDPNRRLIGIIMSQVHEPPESGWGMADQFRAELYAQIDDS